MTQINAYVGFNGQCTEAMTFYKACLGGELTLQKVSETPVASQCAEGMQDQVMHSMLKNDNLLLMGTDMGGPGGYIKGNNIALALNCSSEDKINSSFQKLSEGGEILDALKLQFWGGIFGSVKDKFGIVWMFNYEKDKQG